jgi:signal transduction histidine kinase
VSSAELRAENARLQGALQARLEEVEALRRVATLVARNAPPEQVLDLVTREAARHLGADAAMTARFEGPAVATVLSDWAAPGLETLDVPAAIALDPGTVLEQIQRTGHPARTDSYEELGGEHVQELRDIGMRAGVGAPILVAGELWGAVAAGSAAAPFTADHEQRLHAFAELVGQAIANVEARAKLQQSRARIVEAADAARRKLERDLHDGAQQRLVGLALRLRLLDRQLGPEAGVEPCIRELLGALEDLRTLARGLHPIVLTERGLVAALESLAARSVVPTSVRANLGERLPGPQEIALYFVANEALANVAKYAATTQVEIRVERAAGHASITIADDGRGGADPDGGSGLRGLRDRVEALGGSLRVDSPPGAGTTLSARVPLPGG